MAGTKILEVVADGKLHTLKDWEYDISCTPIPGEPIEGWATFTPGPIIGEIKGRYLNDEPFAMNIPEGKAVTVAKLEESQVITITGR